MPDVLEPDENSKKDISLNSSTSTLPMEKQFTHMVFCQQIQNIDLEAAKQLLTDLHLLYLGQQAVFSNIMKSDFIGNINDG